MNCTTTRPTWYPVTSWCARSAASVSDRRMQARSGPYRDGARPDPAENPSESWALAASRAMAMIAGRV
ncbi:hypothetical protein EES45_08730 [Streptomyces sp. ADI97-07]|nr:hypothetical protein EES45_08730 [Streptomyces sp. ADI97-07]